MATILHFLLALVVILALAWLVSFDRKTIRIRYILQLIVIEIALAFFFLHAESGLTLIKSVSGVFESLLKFSAEGSDFVFGGMSPKGLAFIFLGVLGDLSSRRLFTMAATAMSTVSLSIVGAYMTMLDAKSAHFQVISKKKARIRGLETDDKPLTNEVLSWVTEQKIRKINSLIFGCSPQRRKNHAFSFFVSNLKPAFAGLKEEAEVTQPAT